MAVALRRKDHLREVMIRFDGSVPAVKGRIVIIVDDVPFPLQTEHVGNMFVIKHVDFRLESILLDTAEALVFVLFEPIGDAEPLLEPLFFHQSFFIPFFDFARQSDIYMAQGVYEKPAFLAVFTHVYDDGDMLAIWERHYSRLTERQHLYVLDHGSTSNPRSVLSPDVHVLRVPRGVVDQRGISHFVNMFQRFLLSQYRYVLHVDADELLIHRKGNDAFVESLRRRETEVILKAKHAYDLVQDFPAETAIDLARPLSEQRGSLLFNRDYRKPILASKPSTRGMGFHFALEREQVVEDDDLWLIHLKFADLDLYLKTGQKWRMIEAKEASAEHRAFTPQDDRMIARDRAELLFASLLAHPDRLAMPDWMRGIF